MTTLHCTLYWNKILLGTKFQIQKLLPGVFTLTNFVSSSFHCWYIVNMLYVKIIGGYHCVISAFSVWPHHFLKLFQRFSIHCSQNLHGQWVIPKTQPVVMLFNGRGPESYTYTHGDQTTNTSCWITPWQCPQLPTTAKRMYWTVSSTDSSIQKTRIATYGKIMEELPTHVANTLQMTKSTIRHRLKNLKIRMNMTTWILKQQLFQYLCCGCDSI